MVEDQKTIVLGDRIKENGKLVHKLTQGKKLVDERFQYGNYRKNFPWMRIRS